jgi:tetratricopeptide (TPR) repeat protein
METAADMKAALDSGLTRSQILMRNGMELLSKGELDKAQTVFNTALKFDLKNPELHFLNGLTYHLGYLRGDAESMPLAEAGYHAALQIDPSMDVANLQLGRLLLEAKEYTRAKQAFAAAAAVNMRSTNALYGLAHAAAFDGDLKTSYWAATKLDELKWDNPLLFRVKAIHAALAHLPDRAREYATAYGNATDDSADAKYVMDRVNRLSFMKTSLSTAAPRATAADQPVLLAQAAPQDAIPAAPAAPAAPAVAPAAADAPAAPNAAAPAADPAAPASPAAEASAGSTTRPKWFRCDKEPGIPLQKDVAPQAAPSEEAFTTTVLPAPCPGELPEMAFIEVTMIRTEESQSRNMGINLLDGLSILSTIGTSRTYTGSTGLSEEVRNNNFVLGNTAGGGSQLKYSLNIANAAYTKNEVIARPTLAAIDRVPAVFFSGATITIGVAGAGGGGSTVVDKPVGVSLSVTPTFIDDDNVLVSLRASRSFINSGVGGGSNQILLSQTRNSINASSVLKFGETFVVSGLVERDINDASSGVPLLQDIPVLQYLFKHSEKIDFNRQIITLITIRRVVNSALEAQRAKTSVGGAVSLHALSKMVDELIGLQNANTVVDEVLRGFRSDNMLYNRLRNKDFIQQSIGEKTKLQQFLDEIKSTLYF